MDKFTVTNTTSKTHPFRIEVDGGEVALCSSMLVAVVISEILENDDRHNIIIEEVTG